MWTGLILACSMADPNLCVAASSIVAYEDKQTCEEGLISGVDFVRQRYPDFIIVEGPLCYEWEYAPPNI